MHQGAIGKCAEPCSARNAELAVVAAYTSHGFREVDDNNGCLGAGVPDACCTGAGTGTCTALVTEGFSEAIERVEPIIVPVP